ncbi:chromatin structure-remodeling complex protein RSC2 [Verticillium alfalfae VaMs.102]|uniref:Chromatin structure-remodeling complex protein RSC2 n=1 Tax=Verticillium alfalfae (strain VaMs.102 / ATCC MYA-4576 / FGSC 10136) TaxID=526221 RepID=C9SRC2_VERA1|nr:chromatin structure-remodeling complex protein RSC2 [Verticillium alfalfae VaMs.102]EEY21337.1 chromatin structure-remodeling complex protein RSC2 [Verticillium alfalfae VaMs.102]
MAGTRSNATDVRDSIEAKLDKDKDKTNGHDMDLDTPENAADDVDMKDQHDEEDADGEADAEADADGEDDTSQQDVDEPGDLLSVLGTLESELSRYEEDGEELAAPFQRIPNKRSLPDYFQIIEEPTAFSSIRKKVQKKEYTSASEFVRDLALICHNAQVYNLPSAPIFHAAVRLREVAKEKLQKLVTAGVLTAAEVEFPFLGELPPAEEASENAGEEDEEDEEEEEEEEDDDDSDDDENGRGRKTRKIGRRPDASREEEDHKKRGRPPKVLTPAEVRIDSVLKGLRKFKDESGELRILPFEKLPDKQELPEYYDAIQKPIALDMIRQKFKRKKYATVDDLIQDLDLMFENAKLFNEDDSDIHQTAIDLQREARSLAQQEKAKPDSLCRADDGRLPLAEVQHNGETWRVGDWVHINNTNDVTKPIVAQIFRLWQDPKGQRWINACWYYRPEQTVHHEDKHFYEHEVAKSTQYRDHAIEEVIDRCFVMFVTRFFKGRPRGLPAGKSVYVCESRYNEEKCRFARIKTWSSCVPDEVREKDYVSDPFPHPLRMKKFPSPIKHLIRQNAKPTDPLPKPTWGYKNMPPVIGAVHRRPRESNESPPPQPTPPAQPAQPILSNTGRRPSSFRGSQPPASPFHMAPPGASPSPAPLVPQYHGQQQPQPQPQQHQYTSASPVAHHQSPHQPAPHYPQGQQPQPQQPGQSPYLNYRQPQQPPGQNAGQMFSQQQHNMPQAPMHRPQGSNMATDQYQNGFQGNFQGPQYNQRQGQHPPAYPHSPATHIQQGQLNVQPQSHAQIPQMQPSHMANSGFADHRMSMGTNRNTMAPTAGIQMQPYVPAQQQHLPPQQQQQNSHNAAPSTEVFTLPDELNNEIPEEIRLMYNNDNGKLLWYTTPPRKNRSVSAKSAMKENALAMTPMQREIEDLASAKWRQVRDTKGGPRDSSSCFRSTFKRAKIGSNAAHEGYRILNEEFQMGPNYRKRYMEEKEAARQKRIAEDEAKRKAAAEDRTI